MKRRTLLQGLLAAFTTIPTMLMARPVPAPAARPMIYVEVSIFGPTERIQKFRVRVNHYPQETDDGVEMHYVVPLMLLYRANYIKVIDGPVLKNRNNAPRLPLEMMLAAPLVDNEFLLANGYRYAPNESYTGIGPWEDHKI